MTLASDHILVLHFEAFKRDPQAALRNMIRFLGLGASDKRLSCLTSQDVLQHKRTGKKRVPEGFFDEELSQSFDGYIDKANELLKRHGHESIPTEYYKHYRATEDKASVSKREL